jgi:hypothetical protein
VVKISVVRTLDPNKLDLWLSEWKRGLKEPEELFVGIGLFVNVVQAALGELERRYRLPWSKQVNRTNNNWERRVLHYLEETIKSDSPTVNLLRAEHGDEVDELELLLRQERYDIERIYPLLERIEDAPSLLTIRDALAEEILGEGDRRRLAILARLLARQGLKNWEVRPLRDLPKQALTSSYVSLLVGDRLEDLASDPELTAAAAATWGELVGRAADSPRVADAFDPNPASVMDIFRDDYGWRSVTYRFLDDLRRVWTQILRDHDAGALDEDNLRSLGRETLVMYLRGFVRRVLLMANPPLNEEIVASVREMGRHLHDRLASEGVFSADHDSWEDLYPESVGALAAECLVTASVKHLAQEIAARFASGVPGSQLSALGGQLAGLMLEAQAGGSAPQEVEEGCGEVLARRSTQRELGRFMAPFSGEMLGLIGGLAREAGTAGEVPEYRRFWSLWRDQFADKFRSFEYLPWEALDEDGLRRVIGDVVGRLAGPVEEWQLVFRVGGFGPFEPRERALRFGDVTFYDGRTHDYGEGLWPGSNVQSEPPAAYARVRVLAQGDLAAERAGRRMLNDALDVLTFVYSVRRTSFGGFRPEVLQGVHISRESGGASYHPRLRGTRIPSPLRTEDRNIERFAEVYRGLLAAARAEGFHEEGRSGRVRPGFLRAVRWYAKGCWEPDPIQRFLTHWIGLEHLFVGGEGNKKAIVDEVPKLTVTWRTLGERMLFTSMTLRDLVRRGEGIAALKEEADSLEVLEGWSEDARVLLDPARVRVFALLAAKHDPELAKLAQRHADELRGFAQNYEAIREEVEWMRERESFRLLLLYHLRNKIVHEALPYVPDVEIYADKVEQVLGRVLEAMVDDAVEDEPENEVMEQLLAGHEEQPWLGARRGMPVTDEAIKTLRRAKESIMGGRIFQNDSTDLLNEGREERAGPR